MPLVFSYGTLQRADVQQMTYGRLLPGAADALPGFDLDLAPITDPARAELHGRTHYTNAVPSGQTGSRVQGMVFELTDDELARTDAYEAQDTYVRIEVTLASGATAWVYVHAPTSR